MTTRRNVLLSELTTLHMGGPARLLETVENESELIAVVRRSDSRKESVLLLAGGSNVVIADAGFDGAVVNIRSSGAAFHRTSDEVLATVAAGHSFDDFVAVCVDKGLAGVECLSGIPGSVGATPIQNVGAYGSDIAENIRIVRVYDRVLGEEVELKPEDCRFSYRDSLFKRSERYVVLNVTFGLKESQVSGPLRYGQLTELLGSTGAVPLSTVREAVIGLRRAKGMVIDPDDRDTWSVGSFFVNPVLDKRGMKALLDRCLGDVPPSWQEMTGTKVSAAWLIEKAGFAKGYGGDGVAISTKHTLALTNRGTGTTTTLLKLAREIARGVERRFGVSLTPEPVFVGETW